MSDSSVPPKKEQPIRVFQLNDENAAFEELDLPEDVDYEDLLNSDAVLYFVDSSKFRSYIWTGKEASIRMKFIGAQKASNVRDSIGPAIKISTIEQDEEPRSFKIMVGLEEEIEEIEEQTGPAYEGTDEDEAFLENLPLEKLLLIFEKTGLPEGYKREMVIDGKNLYGYHVSYRDYEGEIVKEPKLFLLKKKVEDGAYFDEGLTPRILMNRNNVLVVELLRKMTDEEMEKAQEEEELIQSVKEAANPFISDSSDE
ncbi:MAG: hypothetical protein ACTSVU_08835 [Promethearchaeota archaeon]